MHYLRVTRLCLCCLSLVNPASRGQPVSQRASQPASHPLGIELIFPVSSGQLVFPLAPWLLPDGPSPRKVSFGAAATGFEVLHAPAINFPAARNEGSRGFLIRLPSQRKDLSQLLPSASWKYASTVSHERGQPASPRRDYCETENGKISSDALRGSGRLLSRGKYVSTSTRRCPASRVAGERKFFNGDLLLGDFGG